MKSTFLQIKKIECKSYVIHPSKHKVMKPLNLSIILFILIAFGSYSARATGWYNSYWFTDVILHSISGIMFGFFWLWYMRNLKIQNVWFQVITIVTFATFASVLWEFWEFAGHYITPNHTQYYIPDLGDTLNDILCGMLGSTIVSFYVFLNSKRESKRML